MKIGEMLDLLVPGANTKDGEGNSGRMGAREMEGGWEMEMLPSRKPWSSEMESEWLAHGPVSCLQMHFVGGGVLCTILGGASPKHNPIS